MTLAVYTSASRIRAVMEVVAPLRNGFGKIRTEVNHIGIISGHLSELQTRGHLRLRRRQRIFFPCHTAHCQSPLTAKNILERNTPSDPADIDSMPQRTSFRPLFLVLTWDHLKPRRRASTRYRSIRFYGGIESADLRGYGRNY